MAAAPPRAARRTADPAPSPATSSAAPSSYILLQRLEQMLHAPSAHAPAPFSASAFSTPLPTNSSSTAHTAADRCSPSPPPTPTSPTSPAASPSPTSPASPEKPKPRSDSMSSTASLPHGESLLNTSLQSQHLRRSRYPRLTRLETDLTAELKRIRLQLSATHPQQAREERRQAYSAALTALLAQLPAAGPSLSLIKQEYDHHCAHRKLQHFRLQERHLQLQQVAARAEAHARLRERLARLDRQQAALEAEQRQLRARRHWALVRRSIVQGRRQRHEAALERREAHRAAIRRRLLQTLGLEQATSPPALQRHLAALQQRLETLRSEFHLHIPKDERPALEAQLRQLEATLETVRAANTRARHQAEQLRLAVDKASNSRRRQLMSRSLANTAAGGGSGGGGGGGGMGGGGGGLGAEGDADLLLEQSAEDLSERATRVLDCIRRFERAFTAGDYSDAALIAVQSPERVLRTAATWERFAAASTERNLAALAATSRSTGRSRLSIRVTAPPILTYGLALLEHNPSAKECLECTKIAHRENRLDIVKQWLAQGKLVCSLELAEFLQGCCRCPPAPLNCTCAAGALAFTVYTRVPAKRARWCALRLLIRLGRQHKLEQIISQRDLAVEDLQDLSDIDEVRNSSMADVVLKEAIARIAGNMASRVMSQAVAACSSTPTCI